MKNKVYALIIILAFFAALLQPCSASDADDDTLVWQGHTLQIVKITTSWKEIVSYEAIPFPSDGYVVLVLLNVMDKSQITEEELERHKVEFLLSDGKGNAARPTNYLYVSDYGVGLYFFFKVSPQNDEVFDLRVLPFDEAPAISTESEVSWQGYRLAIVSCTNEKTLMPGREWPSSGYLVKVELMSADDSLLPWYALFEPEYLYEIVLTDTNGGIYKHIDGWLGANALNDKPMMTLFYEITSDPLPSMENLELTVKPCPIIWFSPYTYVADTSSFREFVPQTPETKTASVFLEASAKYGIDSSIAAAHPQEALRALDADLKEINTALAYAFGDAITISNDPNSASVIIGIGIKYPLAGHYGVTGSVSAYNCELTLTAYDATSHTEITRMMIGAYFGNTISITPGSTRTWKEVPQFADADADEKAAFIADLLAYWDTNDK